MPPSRRTVILVVGYYLAVALWCMRAVLPAFSSTIVTGPEMPPVWRQITAADQKLVVAVVNANAKAIVESPSSLLDGPQCHPLRRALMLGQHELNEGMLGVIPRLVSGDPIATYNVVMLLSLLLPGLAMHALVRDWTGSAAAAFVAGTLFATHPSRLGDVVHLSAIGNYWTVVSLLFLTRLFARPTWPTAVALGLAAAAQSLDSIYPLIPHAVLCGIVGLTLSWRHRRQLGAIAPKLALVLACVAGSAVLVLGPYLAFGKTWGSLAGREQLFYLTTDLVRGGPAFSGVVALALAVVGLVASGRVPGASRAPRAALVLAGVIVVWIAVAGLPLPGLGPLPPLFSLLARILPGFEAVRRGGAAISGWHLVVIVFAGYGVAALTRGRSAATRAIVGVLLTGLALGEVFVPAIARASFARALTFQAYDPRPPAAVRALYPALPPGAVLDVPYELGPGRFFRMADFVVAGAFHGRRVAACYNSFRVAVQEDVVRYAARVLADPQAAAALSALGIGSVIHHLTLPARMPLLPTGTTPAHLVEIGRAAGQVLYRMPAPPPTTSDLDALELRLEIVPTPPAGTSLVLVFRNPGDLLYRHPDPIEPSPFVIRWYDAAGALVAEERAAALRPTVLIPGDEMRRSVPLGMPPSAATVRLAIASAADPTRELASLTLRP